MLTFSLLSFSPRSSRRIGRAGCVLTALLVGPLSSHATRDENDHFMIDEYRYDRDGSNVMNAEDDPGNGGPEPTNVPLGSDAASALLALGGAWYARRALRLKEAALAVSPPFS